MHVVLYGGNNDWIGDVCAVLERECWITVVAVCRIVPVRGVSVDQC